ncbi:CHASE4 domain-containing protein [Arcobacter sp. CECT 8985]|uniref:sensor histidine kinase n=1 Tax=Arcobacter sp. CECT 8985 TaxID=1935424 RepID=UPI00100AAB48|nr:CHASE4 domain-containing protein [Arcobacter sp. CECT 8985]RXJ86071.1 hypothetical protein CRU93_10450 [Arcobacter sp. CECT 8985]
MQNYLKNKYLILTLFILYLIVFNLLTYNYFINDFKKLENIENKKRIYSLVEKIDNEISNLYRTSNDYAAWDDTYDFIVSKDRKYIFENFRENSSTLEGLNLDFMIFVDKNYNTVYSILSSQINNKNKFIKDTIKKYNKDNTPTILKINDNFYYTVKSNILKSDATGKIRGYIFSGRELNIQELNGSLFTKLEISKQEQTNSFYILKTKLLPEFDIYNKYTNDFIISNIQLNNIKNKFFLKSYFKRSLFHKSKEQIYIFNSIISVLFIILIFLIYSYIIYQERQKIELKKKVKEEIDKQRKQEQLLIQQSKLAAMGEMIGNIAHQWRQPLNALGLILQNIHFTYKIGELNEKYLQNSVDKANMLTKNMSKTIDDFRNFFKPNKEKKEFKITHTVEKAIKLMDSTLDNNEITLEKDMQNDIIAYGFENEFSQSILNILSNAKDALLENNIKDAKIKIRSYKTNSDIIVEIEDNAGGIDEDIKNKIFEPYFTTKEEGKGTGIGLYMTKTIIENNMKGKIYTKDVPNGICFVITLPILED